MMKFAVYLVAMVLLVGTLPVRGARADDADKDCIKKITVIENIFDAEKIKYKNDRCQLSKVAQATRAAMLGEIARHQNQCGLKAQFVDMLRAQESSFGSQVSAICR
ncbi:hypothetical protein [Rhizobium sp. 11_C7_N12_5]|uniref:hypothetical protein n=1 Tax=Rhizobium sp. 11_C7_N12_5 TaxID=3240770 RepID=UPI003F21B010